MDHIPDRPDDIDRILREVYERTEPQDSWQALRERIDATLSRQNEHARDGRGQLVFWRRMALALAACLVAATGLLFHVVATNRRAASLPVAGAPALLTHAQIEPLIRAFSQARGLFADHQLWLMLDSTGNSQIGLTPNDASVPRGEEIIVLRLVMREDDGPAGPRYADLVAYPRQRISLTMQTAAGSTIELHLMPTLRQDGRVDLDFTAQSDNGPRTARVTPVGPNAFTPLAQMQVGRHDVSLDAVAQPVSLAEQG